MTRVWCSSRKGVGLTIERVDLDLRTKNLVRHWPISWAKLKGGSDSPYNRDPRDPIIRFRVIWQDQTNGLSRALCISDDGNWYLEFRSFLDTVQECAHVQRNGETIACPREESVAIVSGLLPSARGTSNTARYSRNFLSRNTYLESIDCRSERCGGDGSAATS